MGGIVASLQGVPLVTPVGYSAGNAMGGMDSFLVGADGLSDLLHREGYHLVYMGGASRSYAGKDVFFRTHHFDEVLGREDLQGKIEDPSYRSDWGLYDDSLFLLAEEKVKALLQGNRPFGLFLLTLDTHHPFGFPSRTVADVRYKDGKDEMQNSVAGASKLISTFVSRLRRLSEGTNTIIVLASDHLAFRSQATDRMDPDKRRNLFMVFPSRPFSAEMIDTWGTSLDYAPTILPFLGFRGEVGLGFNLRDHSIRKETREHIVEACNDGRWNSELLKLWSFPKLIGPLVIDTAGEKMTLSNRKFRIPVLIEVGGDAKANLAFGFDSPLGYLAQKAFSGGQLVTEIYIGKTSEVESFMPKEAQVKTEWVLLTIRKGQITQVIPLGSLQTLDAKSLVSVRERP